MSFDWNRYLDVAKDLSNKNGEEYARASISRAYYALYNVLLEKTDLADDEAGQGGHTKLKNIFLKDRKRIKNLKRLKQHEFKIITDTLKSLKDWRQNADYYANPTIAMTQKLAKEACKLVELVFSIIKPPP